MLSQIVQCTTENPCTSSALDHAITIKDVLMASGAVIGVVVVFSVLIGILAVLASGWNH